MDEEIELLLAEVEEPEFNPEEDVLDEDFDEL